jgi:hypothetical protein
MNPIIFQAPYATVTFEEKRRFLLLQWHGNPTSEEYKKPFQAMLEFGRKEPVDSMLSDISKQGVINPENRKWFEKEMMPAAIAAGLRRAAIVTNGNAFKMYYINLILSAVRKFPVTTKVFNSQEDANKWIDSFPVSTHKLAVK